MNRVDVIMATYNGQKYIRQQIDSILQNQGVDVVLHIFDDGSSDDTLDILKEYQKAYSSRIMIYPNKINQGPTLNFLQGIRCVMEEYQDAQYFMCCDQDDVWNEDKIKVTLKRMMQLEKYYSFDQPLLVFTDATITDENLGILETSFYKSQRYDLGKLNLAHLLMENLVIGCTMMINRAFEPYLMNLPKMARYHDWWLALIAASFGNINLLKKQTLQYRQHANNVVGGARFDQYILQRVKNLKVQKERLLDNKKQATEFHQLFCSSLSQEKLEILEHFVQMFDDPWIKRRYQAVHYGFLKSGILRNIGLLLIL